MDDYRRTDDIVNMGVAISNFGLRSASQIDYTDGKQITEMRKVRGA